MDRIYICFDLESTCHDRASKAPEGFRNEIIEIGAVMYDNYGRIDEFQAFVRPHKFPELSDFCKTLTTITQKDVDGAKFFPEVLQDFKQWFTIPNRETVFVSWGHYDRNQLRDDCQMHGVDKEWINEGNHISLKHKYAEWNKLKKGIGLGRACKEEGLVFEGTAHRGIDDAGMVGKIFMKYISKIKSLWDTQAA